VKIYLLSIDSKRFFFYSDVSEAADDETDGTGLSGPSQSGLRGWLLRQFQRFQAGWQQAESGVGYWTRRAWEWLHSWARPDESMLVRLWRARRIDLHHPAGRTGEEVRVLWTRYLSHRWWHHLVFLGANGVVAPLSVLLAILPGPNVIGYWFAYRAIYHLLIVRGIGRVRKARIPIELHPAPLLDKPIGWSQDGKATHVAIDGEAALLDEHVAWTEADSWSSGGARAGAVSPLAAAQKSPEPGLNGPDRGDHEAP
jgi:hypothetical protein